MAQTISDGGSSCSSMSVDALCRHLAEQYNLDEKEPNSVQKKLEEKREQARSELQQLLKLKAGAERIRGASNTRNSRNNVASWVKDANSQVQDLSQEIEELNTHLLLITQYDPVTCTGESCSFGVCEVTASEPIRG